MLNTLRTYTDQQRHDYVLKKYILNSQTSNQKRDIDIIREGHRFLWDDESKPQSWEERLVRKYYNKLFKEYCIGDLTYYKNNKIGLRWRTESEVISGKGQFQCACVKCEERTELRTWEVNFAYLERGEKKNTLIKIRLCPQHSTQ
ncbi:protein FRA10AC1-like, partial [Teleopsis dalmanni]